MTVVEKVRGLGKPGDDPVQQAIASARKAIDVHSQGQERITRLQVELNSAIESESAGAVEALEAGTEVPDGGRAEKITAQISVMQRASETTRARALEGIAAIYGRAAEAERRLAEEKHVQRAEILTKIRKPLAELSLIEGVEFTPFILKSQPQGIWEPRFGVAAPDFNLCGPGDCFPGVSMVNPQPYAVPLSETLNQEIAAHERRAAELAERVVDLSGDLDDILQATIREVTPPAVKAEAA